MEILHSAVYATQPKPLQRQIETLLRESNQPSAEDEVLAVIAPDTNLLSGGVIAAKAFNALQGHRFDCVIAISPSHTGNFRRITICSLDAYRTPLGELRIDEHARQELCDEDDDIYLDDTGHFHTQGIDVQLPFLQTILDDFEIVPIVMGTDSPEFCRELGAAVGEIMFNRKTLIVSSVDILSSSEDALIRFKTMFEQGDVNGLMSLLNDESVTMQGKGALLVALIASLHRRGKRFQILELNAPQNGTPGSLGAIITR